MDVKYEYEVIKKQNNNRGMSIIGRAFSAEYTELYLIIHGEYGSFKYKWEEIYSWRMIPVYDNQIEPPTLRDQFAMAALHTVVPDGYTYEERSIRAYKQADAMLAARKQTGGDA